jgi:cytochrome c oxidase assembly protein subunit 15
LQNFTTKSRKNPDLPRKSGAEEGDVGRIGRIGRVARATLGYTVAVVLFGAVVRISGSGAGCGQHWPSCNGELAHLPKHFETAIELTHRVTAGATLVPAIYLAVLAFRSTARGHRLRKAALLGVGLTIAEDLIGAALVLFGLVNKNVSTTRAVVMPLHLLFTYGLVATLTLAACWTHPSARSGETTPAGELPRRWVLLGALGVLLVAATGAVTALGDTVYPPLARSLMGRVTEDQGESAHLLQRFRGVHPVLALLTATGLAWLAGSLWAAPNLAQRSAGRVLLGFVLAQVVAGVSNVVLSAPGWLQVVHLALSLGLWISLITLIGVSRRSAPA